MMRGWIIGALLVFVAGNVLASQRTDPRHFYAANRDGTGVDQWVKRKGYRTIFEFFKINANDQFYQLRVLYVFDSDPNKRPFVYDEATGNFIGRWDNNGYSNLPGREQRPNLNRIPGRAFPPGNLNPALPYSRDRYPRSVPPPIN